MARIRSGFILKEILDRMKMKVDGTLKPDRSVHIYSAHDTLLSCLLYALDMFDVSSTGGS